MASSNVGSDETTKMNLQHDITVNGKTYKAGQNVEVPKKQAEDIARIDFEHSEYERSLHKKRVYERDMGTMAVGGGE